MTKIITSNESKTGYAIQDGDLILNIDEIVDDGKTLKLPENSSNRRYYSIRKVQEGKTELTYKASMTYGPRTPKKNWADYLTEEERQIIEDIKNLCLQRMEADKPSVQELELRKLIEKRDRLMAKIAELSIN